MTDARSPPIHDCMSRLVCLRAGRGGKSRAGGASKERHHFGPRVLHSGMVSVAKGRPQAPNELRGNKCVVRCVRTSSIYRILGARAAHVLGRATVPRLDRLSFSFYSLSLSLSLPGGGDMASPADRFLPPGAAPAATILKPPIAIPASRRRRPVQPKQTGSVACF